VPVSPTPDRPADFVEPATVVATMAEAVDRVRRLARRVFDGDAALFDASTDETSA